MLAKRTDRDHRQLNTVLRSLIGKLDGVLIRAWVGNEEEYYKYCIGLGNNNINPPGQIDWNETQIKYGRFILYKPSADLHHFLTVCVSNMNPISKEVVVLRRVRIESKKYHDVQSDLFKTTSTSIDSKPKIDTVLLPLDMQSIDEVFSLSKIEKKATLIKKEGSHEIAVECTDVITSKGQTKIKFKYYTWEAINIQVNAENTKITPIHNMTYIPNRLQYDTPIAYYDHSPAADQSMILAPSTFVAMYQYEAVKGRRFTSMKRYFHNARLGINGQKWKWRVFCGRTFKFQDEVEAHGDGENQIIDIVVGTEEERTESDRSESHSDGTDRSSLDFRIPSSTISDKSVSTAPPSESVDFNTLEQFPILDDRIDDISVHSTALGCFNEEGRLTTTTMKRFNAESSRIFMNLFVIFHHWVRHDEYKGESADTALWDPEPTAVIFDYFYRAHIEETNMRPWMFSVTQALRDWISDLIYEVAVSSRNDRAMVKVDPLTDNVELIIIERGDRIERILQNEFSQIWKLFEGLSETFKKAREQVYTGETVTPIYAALDYENVQGRYDSLKQRGERILLNAFNTAFPVDTLNGIGTGTSVDFSNYDVFFQYIQKQVAQVQMGIFDIEIPLRKETLGVVSLRQLVGTMIKKDTPEFEVIKQQPHLPLLFPKLLRRNDILVIYDNEGCIPVRFLKYDTDDAGITHHETEHAEQDAGRQVELYRRYKAHQFSPNLSTLHYSLNPKPESEQLSDDSLGTIQNLVDVYVLIKKPNEPYPEDRPILPRREQ